MAGSSWKDAECSRNPQPFQNTPCTISIFYYISSPDQYNRRFYTLSLVRSIKSRHSSTRLRRPVLRNYIDRHHSIAKVHFVEPLHLSHDFIFPRYGMPYSRSQRQTSNPTSKSKQYALQQPHRAKKNPIPISLCQRSPTFPPL